MADSIKKLLEGILSISSGGLNLKDVFGPAVVHADDLTVDIGTNFITIKKGDLEIGIDTIDCRFSVSGRNFEVNFKNTSDAEETVSQTSVDMATVQIGDVLGRDFDLPEGLEHWENWVVYDIMEDGAPKALEPKCSALDGLVDVETAQKHLTVLREQGYSDVRFPKDADSDAIYRNIASTKISSLSDSNAGNNNVDAQLELGEYYLMDLLPDEDFVAFVDFYDDGKLYPSKGDIMFRARAVANITALTPKSQLG